LAETHALLFDLDGTLLDTAPDMIAAANALRVEAGLAMLAPALIRPHVSKGGRAILRVAFAHLDEAARELLLPRFLERYRADIARETRLFPGVDDLLLMCCEHQIQLGIVTNKPGWLTDALLDALDLRKIFGVVVSGDTLAEKKPHPAPVQHALAALGAVARSTWMFGDDLRDIEAGRAAGTRTAVAAFGYIDSGDDLTQWGADLIVRDARELIAYLD
jgi:phosphoglycolate phosphatase